jgi:hypothetical protein
MLFGAHVIFHVDLFDAIFGICDFTIPANV